MKIGIFTPYLDTLSGGEKYILTLALCLAKKNSVSLFWDRNEEAGIKETVLRKFGLDITPILFDKNIFSKTTPFYSRFKESKKYDIIIVLSDGSIPLLGCKTYIHFQLPLLQPSPYQNARLDQDEFPDLPQTPLRANKFLLYYSTSIILHWKD